MLYGVCGGCRSRSRESGVRLVPNGMREREGGARSEGACVTHYARARTPPHLSTRPSTVLLLLLLTAFVRLLTFPCLARPYLPALIKLSLAQTNSV